VGLGGVRDCEQEVVERGLCGVWGVDGDALRPLDDLHGI
jgi:hypothetical protein